MKLKQVIANLEHLCPPQFAEPWDNSGLQVGQYEQEISTVCLAVDATPFFFPVSSLSTTGTMWGAGSSS